MRFAPFPTINSILSNAAELRLKSRHVVGVHIENRPTMTMRDWATELPHSNEECDLFQGGTTRMPTARGPVIADFKDVSRTELQRLGVNCV
jgi:hypothetical protein